ncbi:hypothetical protein [Clostridium sp. DL1XJH146]
MNNLDKIIKDIENGKADMQLINEEVKAQEKDFSKLDGFSMVHSFKFNEGDKFIKSIVEKDEQLYYVERDICADEDFYGTCNLEYDKIYLLK